jgi:quercetin dioxygenase-like cupin family protein
MIRIAAISLSAFFLSVSVASAQMNSSVLPDVPEGVQAMSLLGEELRSGAPSESVLGNLATAKANYEADSDDADNIIWYGRRIAYTGDYRGAIAIFSEGVEKHPENARFYRHRGHRYISIREFDRAIVDFEKAATLIEGTEDEVEPDGAPNFAMRQFEVEPGGFTPKHSHPYEHEVYVLEGEGIAMEGNEQRPLRSGDFVYVPPDEVHQFRNTGDVPMKFLCMIPHVPEGTPVRQAPECEPQ